MEGAEVLDIPPRAVAALTLPHTVTSLLVVSRATYQRALDMHQVGWGGVGWGCAWLPWACTRCHTWPPTRSYARPHAHTLLCTLVSQEYTVTNKVDRCCRLPFLRHNPLKVRARP